MFLHLSACKVVEILSLTKFFEPWMENMASRLEQPSLTFDGLPIFDILGCMKAKKQSKSWKFWSRRRLSNIWCRYLFRLSERATFFRIYEALSTDWQTLISVNFYIFVFSGPHGFLNTFKERNQWLTMSEIYRTLESGAKRAFKKLPNSNSIGASFIRRTSRRFTEVQRMGFSCSTWESYLVYQRSLTLWPFSISRNILWTTWKAGKRETSNRTDRYNSCNSN